MIIFKSQRCKDGYKIDDGDDGDLQISAVSDNFEDIIPIPTHQTLFRQFCDIGSPTSVASANFKRQESSIKSQLNTTGILKFAEGHGLLTNVKPTESESLHNWDVALSNMNTAVKCWQSYEYETLVSYFDGDMVGRSSSKLVITPDYDAPQLEEVALTLLDAMWAQFALAVAKMEAHLQCDQCGDWFVPQRSRKSKYKFCSPKCQKKHQHLRRKKETKL